MPEPMPLHAVVDTWQAVRATAARLEKRARMAALFASAAPEDVRRAASWLAGEIAQGALSVGWSTLQNAARSGANDLPLFAAERAAAPPLTLAEVEASFARLRMLSGAGVERKRAQILGDLLARARDPEREFLTGLLLGETRTGALRSLVVDALAAAFQVPLETLRRAIMFAGDFPAVVEALARDGPSALERFVVRPLVPIEPMLASVAASATEAVTTLGEAAIEWKLDGVRVQLHRDGDVLRAFTRQLRDVTDLVPEIVTAARAFPSASFVLDGEVVTFDAAGKPIPFQDLMSEFSREGNAEPLSALYFDVLVLDGVPLVDRPYRERRAALERLVPESARIPATVTSSPAEAEALFAAAIARGHEGVLAKSLDAPYAAGRRGGAWLKVKPAVTLDLVILAAEWGHGRRQGWLSNLHLGARLAGESGRFGMLGKTFKGLTDEMLRELTRDLPALETHRDAFTVYVRPERVVEIAFDAVQRSPRYDTGLALRFARVKRFRPDKRPEEAATLDEVRALAAPSLDRGRPR